MSAGRQLRDPLPQSEFAQLTLPVKALTLSGHWFNLRWKKYATPERTFFASLSGRLTPASGAVECLYLARDAETAFEELYGDFYDAAEKAGSVFRLPLEDANNRAFLHTTAALDLRVYDLTARGAGKRIGLDLGTLYAPEIDHTRVFAQRIHDHPAKFDGILYRSRLMSTRCVVVWPTYRKEVPPLKHDSFLKDHLTESLTIDPHYYLFKRRTLLAVVV